MAEAGVGLWIWSVWTWRLRTSTSFRALGAKNILQEFQTYGYPTWVFKVVGLLKLSFSGCLIAAIAFPDPTLTLVGACGMVGLMVVAILSHFKVGDALSRNGAAVVMLILSSYTLWVTYSGMKAHCFKSTIAHVPDHFRHVFGGCVAGLCLMMWLRSYLKGDYNLNNYNDETLLGA